LPPDTPVSDRSDGGNPFTNLNVGAWPVRGPRDLEGMRYLPERAEVVQFTDFSSAHQAPELADFLAGMYVTPDVPPAHPLRKLFELQPPATLDYVLSAGRFGNIAAAMSNPAQSGSATEYVTTLFQLRKPVNQDRIIRALRGEPGAGVPGFASYRLPSFKQAGVAQSAFLLFPETDDRLVIVAQSVKDDITAVVGSSGSMNTAMQSLLGSLEPSHFWLVMSLDSFRPLLMLATAAAGTNLPPEIAGDLKPVLNEIPRARGIILQARLQESVLRASLGLSFDSPGPAGVLSNSLTSLWSNKLRPTLAGAEAQSKVAGDIVRSLRFAVRGYGVHMNAQVTVPALAADYPMMAEAMRSLPAMTLGSNLNLPNPGTTDVPPGMGTGANIAPGAAGTSSANPEPMAPAPSGSGSSLSPSGLAGRSHSNPNAPFGVEVGLRAPDIEGMDADGKPIRLSEFKGKIIALDFWGYWCPPCRSMIPHERELVEKLREEPFVFVGVNTDARGHYQNEKKKEPVTWRNFMDGQRGPICRKYKIEAFPTIFLIDANGVIRHKFVGVPPKDVLDKAIDELIAELKGR
jgi:thiol-disulfide isomerase/thioredoxin